MTLSANFTSKSVFAIKAVGRALTFALARLSC